MGIEMVNGVFPVGRGVGPEVCDDILHRAFDDGQKFTLWVGILVMESPKNAGLGAGDVLQDPARVRIVIVHGREKPAAGVMDFEFCGNGDSVDMFNFSMHLGSEG